MKQKIAVMLIMIMTATIMFSSFAYAEADNKVGIKIEFDKKAYVKGETAAATLTLTGLSDEKEAGLNSIKIALDGIAVIVNKDNTLDSITSEQIKNIYTGSLTKWSEIK